MVSNQQEKNKITNEEIRNSLIYLGSGTDIQPILRFSQFADTFIYINWGTFYTEEAVQQSIENKIQYLNRIFPDSLVLESGQKNCYFDINRPTRNFDEIFETEKDLQDFNNEFNEATIDKLWVYRFEFTRIIKTIHRRMNLYFINAEGLQTYLKLTDNGSIAPKIICTIQTGHLEKSSGIMNSFLNLLPQKPALWVRGGWSEPVKYTYGFPERENNLDFVLNEDGLYNARVQNISFYNTILKDNTIPRGPGGENPYRNNAVVNVFTRNEIHAPLTELENESIKIILHNQGSAINFSDFDKVFLTRFSYERSNQDDEDRSVFFEDIFNNGNLENSLPPATWSSILDHIGDYCIVHNLEKVAVIPVGFEDEGEYIRHWMNDYSKNNKKLSINLFVSGVLDFADVFGFII